MTKCPLSITIRTLGLLLLATAAHLSAGFVVVENVVHQVTTTTMTTTTTTTRLWEMSPSSSPSASSSSSAAGSTTTPPAPAENVVVLPDAAAVGAQIRAIVREAAARAIAEKDSFALAIPGGSVLKMLAGSGAKDEEWTCKTHLVFVNHKCVDVHDESLSTHAKARRLFLDAWRGCNTIALDGTARAPAEAKAYGAKIAIRLVDEGVLPVRDGIPVLDLALIGVGDDGHIGSLYPGRDEVLQTGHPWVLPVEIKDPPSITLNLDVLRGARQVVVAACGVSDKYPRGKAAGMRRAIADEAETLATFPAVGLRPVATWILDEAAASQLGEAYHNAK